MTQSRYAPTDKELAQAAGYEVSDDPDQPGLFQWIRRELSNGALVEGSDQSFDTASEAWDDAIAQTIEIVMGDLDLSDVEWDRMSQKDKLEAVRELFG